MKGLIEYLSRVGKSRGFGIQSPWAYSFVREVIFETCPYYAYKEIDKRVKSKKDREWARLHFRIANFVNPKQCVELSLSNSSVDDITLVLSQSDSVGVVILTNIHESKETESRLQEIKDDTRVGVVFDLYDEIICFPPSMERPKQYYKLNF